MIEKGMVVVINPNALVPYDVEHLRGLRGVVERVDEKVQRPVVVSFEGFALWYNFREDELAQVALDNPMNFIAKSDLQLILAARAKEEEKRIAFKNLPHDIIDAGYGNFFLPLYEQLESCPICNRFMVSHLSRFGKEYQKLDLVAYGMRLPGSSQYACEKCVEEGLVGFTCAICKQKRSSDQIQEEHEGEIACTVCYETLPAKEWDQHINRVYESHRYD